MLIKTCYCSANDSVCNKIKSSLKETYDYFKSEEKTVKKSSALPELILRNFDLEQIWQQIELQNESTLSHFITNVSKLVVGKNQLIFDNLKEELENHESNKNKDKHIEESDGDDLLNGEEINEISNSESDSNEHDLNDDDEVSEKETVATKPSNTLKRKSVVDDDFFNLDEMEKFLNIEEKKNKNNDKEESDSNDSDNELENSVDLFKEDSDEDEKTKTAKFKDFFVAKDNDKRTKRNKFLESMSDDELSNDNEMKSSLELRQERLKKKIEELEQNAISEKSWQLKGEIRADDRPQNSLLEEIVEFDLTSRPGKSKYFITNYALFLLYTS